MVRTGSHKVRAPSITTKTNKTDKTGSSSLVCLARVSASSFVAWWGSAEHIMTRLHPTFSSILSDWAGEVSEAEHSLGAQYWIWGGLWVQSNKHLYSLPALARLLVSHTSWALLSSADSLLVSSLMAHWWDQTAGLSLNDHHLCTVAGVRLRVMGVTLVRVRWGTGRGHGPGQLALVSAGCQWGIRVVSTMRLRGEMRVMGRDKWSEWSEA